MEAIFTWHLHLDSKQCFIYCCWGWSWVPGRVGAHMGPYGPMWALMGPPGQVLEKRKLSVNFPSTFRKTIWTNFARFGPRNGILMKFLNDSASFLLEKLKNHVILTKNPNIWPKIPKIPQKSRKIPKNPAIPRVPRWRPMWRPMWRTYVSLHLHHSEHTGHTHTTRSTCLLIWLDV